MRAAGLAIVEHAAVHGFLVWEGGIPRLMLSDDTITLRTVRSHWQTIQAVLRRAEAFGRQLASPGPDPFCRYRESRWCPPGTCPSCGGKTGEYEFLRCDLCAVAMQLALVAPVEKALSHG